MDLHVSPSGAPCLLYIFIWLCVYNLHVQWLTDVMDTDNMDLTMIIMNWVPSPASKVISAINIRYYGVYQYNGLC